MLLLPDRGDSFVFHLLIAFSLPAARADSFFFFFWRVGLTVPAALLLSFLNLLLIIQMQTTRIAECKMEQQESQECSFFFFLVAATGTKADFDSSNVELDVLSRSFLLLCNLAG